MGSDGTRDARDRLKWFRLSPLEREDNTVLQYLQLLDEYSRQTPFRPVSPSSALITISLLIIPPAWRFLRSNS